MANRNTFLSTPAAAMAAMEEMWQHFNCMELLEYCLWLEERNVDNLTQELLHYTALYAVAAETCTHVHKQTAYSAIICFPPTGLLHTSTH